MTIPPAGSDGSGSFTGNNNELALNTAVRINYVAISQQLMQNRYGLGMDH